MSTSTVKKRIRKKQEKKKKIPLKIVSWGLFEALGFIFQCSVFIVH